MKIILYGISLIALMLSSYSLSAPVTETERTEIDLRRTTLVVKDIEHSLEFYRDALGMNVIYDNQIISPRNASIEKADKVSRLVFLRANDDYIGIIGLLQYIKPKKPSVDLKNTSFNEGTLVLVFNSEKLESTFAKAVTVEGVHVLSEPRLVSYPSYDGKNTISVMVSVLQDPDGFTIELNQLQDELNL